MQTQIQVREEIAARLKQARENAGFLSAKDFCEQHGLTTAEYTGHETGKKSLKASQAIAYCKLMQVSLRWLMLGTDNVKPVNRKTRQARSNKKTES